MGSFERDGKALASMTRAQGPGACSRLSTALLEQVSHSPSTAMSETARECGGTLMTAKESRHHEPQSSACTQAWDDLKVTLASQEAGVLGR